MKNRYYQQKTALALLFVQSCFIAGAKFMGGEEGKKRVLLSEVTMRASFFVSPKCATVARRIASARVERALRQLNGRRLPA